ncbi:hypothetical protein DAI22_07g176050 [Oryza sativa Japonica Group]|nr:hypothetical protein DAI22_07g176050 [Oryza sativa Japonica Group]
MISVRAQAPARGEEWRVFAGSRRRGEGRHACSGAGRWEEKSSARARAAAGEERSGARVRALAGGRRGVVGGGREGRRGRGGRRLRLLSSCCGDMQLLPLLPLPLPPKMTTMVRSGWRGLATGTGGGEEGGSALRWAAACHSCGSGRGTRGGRYRRPRLGEGSLTAAARVGGGVGELVELEQLPQPFAARACGRPERGPSPSSPPSPSYR